MKRSHFVALLGDSATPATPVYNPVTALGASLFAYWDADRLDLITKDGSDLVSSWVDIVAGYNVAQATDAAKPTYSATGLNSLPSIRGDGGDDLTLTPSPLPSGGTPYEVWALVDQERAAGAGATTYYFGSGDENTGDRRYCGRTHTGGVNRVRHRAGTGSADVDVTGSVVDFSGIHVARTIFSASALTAETDGTADGTAAVTLGGTVTTRLRLFAPAAAPVLAQWFGKMSALLVTDLLDSGQATALRNWLKARGGIA